MALDIHPPTKPIHSVKDFLLHLFTITRGILIALGLEGVVERAHHRNLAREAKTNLVREMTDNHRGLSGGLKSMETTDAQLQSILNTVRALAADRSAKPGNLDLSVSINTPSSTAWSTAATTGALGYMERDDVERFTKVYDLQQVFMSAEQLELESYGALAHGPLARISDAQAVEAERAAGRALAATRMAEDIGKSLEAEYRKLLAATK